MPVTGDLYFSSKEMGAYKVDVGDNFETRSKKSGKLEDMSSVLGIQSLQCRSMMSRGATSTSNKKNHGNTHLSKNSSH